MSEEKINLIDAETVYRSIIIPAKLQYQIDHDPVAYQQAEWKYFGLLNRAIEKELQ